LRRLAVTLRRVTVILTQIAINFEANRGHFEANCVTLTVILRRIELRSLRRGSRSPWAESRSL
jgi:hypothetical protein